LSKAPRFEPQTDIQPEFSQHIYDPLLGQDAQSWLVANSTIFIGSTCPQGYHNDKIV